MSTNLTFSNQQSLILPRLADAFNYVPKFMADNRDLLLKKMCPERFATGFEEYADGLFRASFEVVTEAGLQEAADLIIYLAARDIKLRGIEVEL